MSSAARPITERPESPVTGSPSRVREQRRALGAYLTDCADTLLLDSIGTSLRYATATVNKVKRTSRGQSDQEPPFWTVGAAVLKEINLGLLRRGLVGPRVVPNVVRNHAEKCGCGA